MNRLLLLLLLLLPTALFGQSGNFIQQGNEQYRNGDYAGSLQWYEKALQTGEQDFEARFNLGDALYRSEQFDAAAQQFEELANSNLTNAQKAQAYHNLGNTKLAQQDFQGAVDAYKHALRNSPDDDFTRYNLAYAQRLLQQQQQEQNEGESGDEGNEDEQENDGEEENEDTGDDGNENESEGENEDEGDGERDDEEEGENDEENEGENEPQDGNENDQDPQEQPQPNGEISKDNAERMLDALNEMEQAAEGDRKKGARSSRRIVKDW